jgi:hypothetical protein
MRAAPAPSEARSLRLARRRRRVTAWPPHGLCLSASAFPGPACRAAHRLLPARPVVRARSSGAVPPVCADRSSGRPPPPLGAGGAPASARAASPVGAPRAVRRWGGGGAEGGKMAAAHWYSTALTRRGQSAGSMAGPRAVRTSDGLRGREGRGRGCLWRASPGPSPGPPRAGPEPGPCG